MGLRQLAEGILLPFAGARSGRLEIAGPDVSIRPTLAVSMGLILHELATNAAKHGAWSGDAGNVRLRSDLPVGASGPLRLVWEEQDGPPVAEPERHGFGLRFIRRSAQYEMHGEARISFGPSGLRCTLEVPLDGASGTAAPGDA